MRTRASPSRQDATTSAGLARYLRSLRQNQELPLWKVAHASQMDSTHLSKIELGQRLPTREQTAALAKFFAVDVTELESMRMAEKFLSDNNHNPAAVALAATRIQENAAALPVNNKRTGVNYRTKSVQKSKKKA